jgi:serine/threonine protein kinase
VKYSSVGINFQYHVATAHGLVPGYRWLYEVPKILHRDISLNNLMLRKEDGNIYAVLNDLDLAVNADVQSQSSKHRTGTKPFMAIDLLSGEPTVHMYRHDLESLLYVLVWIISRFHDGVEIEKPPLKEWTEGDLVRVKTSFVLTAPFQSTERFQSFRHWVTSMRKMFIDGLWAKSQVDPALSCYFDNDTLGGFVTFEAFQSILDANLL